MSAGDENDTHLGELIHLSTELACADELRWTDHVATEAGQGTTEDMTVLEKNAEKSSVSDEKKVIAEAEDTEEIARPKRAVFWSAFRRVHCFAT